MCDTCALSSDMKTYAGELRAFRSALICALIRIGTPSHPPLPFLFQFQDNHNLIKEFPTVKYEEEEGESGLSFSLTVKRQDGNGFHLLR